MKDLTYIQKRYFDIVQNAPKEELAAMYMQLLMEFTAEQKQTKWLETLADFYADLNDDSPESAKAQKEIDKLFKDYCKAKKENEAYKEELAFVIRVQHELKKIL